MALPSALSSKMAAVRALSLNILVAVLTEFTGLTTNNAAVALDNEYFMSGAPDRQDPCFHGNNV
jgi:hypothetical protein